MGTDLFSNEPSFAKPPEVIDLPRLRLRRSQLSDAGAIFEYAGDPEVARYVVWPISLSVESVIERIRGRVADWSSGAEFHWVLTLPADDRAIGSIACSLSDNAAEFGFVVNRRYWCNGYATEAAHAVADWIFSVPAVCRLSATCDVENGASARVLEKVGLIREGILQRAIVRPNLSAEPRDAFLYSKLRSYSDIAAQLRRAYDRHAVERDTYEQPEWKLAERALFLERLRSEGKASLLEIGAGTGQDSLFFQESGLRVVATDLSEAMVRFCRAKGLEAHVMDCLNLRFAPASFDAAYAFKSLLHVPNAELPAVLRGVQEVLAPGALFYIGTYAGNDSEGPLANDSHDPPRFFSFRSDAMLLRMVEPYFEVADFRVMGVADRQLQALTLRKSQD